MMCQKHHQEKKIKVALLAYGLRRYMSERIYNELFHRQDDEFESARHAFSDIGDYFTCPTRSDLHKRLQLLYQSYPTELLKDAITIYVPSVEAAIADYEKSLC
jgi:hypothetical protein